MSQKTCTCPPAQTHVIPPILASGCHGDVASIYFINSCCSTSIHALAAKAAGPQWQQHTHHSQHSVAARAILFPVLSANTQSGWWQHVQAACSHCLEPHTAHTALWTAAGAYHIGWLGSKTGGMRASSQGLPLTPCQPASQPGNQKEDIPNPTGVSLLSDNAHACCLRSGSSSAVWLLCQHM